MATMMWIEVLGRDGEVLARSRIDSPEARIGRAFDNDVVIDDPHVAPHHLRIHRGEDGELAAEDLGTLNGLYPEHGARRVTRLPLARVSGIRIGRTTLRVHDAAHPVPAERLLTPPRDHARWGAGLAVGLFALILMLNWLELTSEPSANLVLLPMLGLATALALWTGLWSVLSRIFFGQSQFALNLRIAVTACIAIVLWDQLTETLSFAFAWRDIVEHAGLGAWAILAAEPQALHARVVAPRAYRVAQLAARGFDAKAAETLLERSDAERARYFKTYYGLDVDDATHFDLVLNAQRLGVEGAAELIVARARALGW